MALAGQTLNERLLRTQYAVASALANSQTLKDAADSILTSVCEGLEWDVGGIWLPEPTGELTLQHLWLRPGVEPSAFQGERWRGNLRRGEDIPGQVWADGTPFWIKDVTNEGSFQRGWVAAEIGLRAAFGFPIQVRDEVLGVVEFFSRQRRDADEALLDAVASLGRQIGTFILQERANQLLLDRVSQRTFAAKLATRLASSLDYEEVLQLASQLLVPELADWCAIEVENDDTPRLLSNGLDDEAQAETVRRLVEYVRDHGRPADNGSRTDEPLLLPEVPDSALQTVQDDAHVLLLHGNAPRSAVVIPLKARGRLLATLTLAYGKSDRRYSEDDLSHVEDLARSIALAADNARLFSQSEQMRDQLRKASSVKDDFLGFVSHELRTPLTTIYGGAKILSERGERLDNTTRDSLAKDIETETERLRRVVDNLLVLARPERYGEQVATEPVRVSRSIKRIAERFGDSYEGRLVVRMPVDLPLILGEPTYVEQILRNLLSNAMKYGPSDETIEIVAEEQSGEVIVSICDRGPGVPPEATEAIFDRYYRRPDTQAEAQGIGLGLAVCKRLIGAQSGRIWAEPRKGGGLTVAFALPACAVDEDEA